LSSDTLTQFIPPSDHMPFPPLFQTAAEGSRSAWGSFHSGIAARRKAIQLRRGARNKRSSHTMKTLQLFLGALSIASFTACERKAGRSDTHDGHVHVAPHGGTLVELGEHAYAVELVRDDAAGRLTAYVFDGHVEKSIRITSPTLELIAMPGGSYTPVSMKAVANPITGETIGDTSQFEASAEWLKTAGEFAGIFTIEIRGTRYEQVAYSLPK
jgi:hypothetical protein